MVITKAAVKAKALLDLARVLDLTTKVGQEEQAITKALQRITKAVVITSQPLALVINKAAAPPEVMETRALVTTTTILHRLALERAPTRHHRHQHSQLQHSRHGAQAVVQQQQDRRIIGSSSNHHRALGNQQQHSQQVGVSLCRRCTPQSLLFLK